MCDPENSSERRSPFLILSYFVVTIMFLVMININEDLVHSMSGHIIFFPFTLMSIVHLVTLLGELSQRIDETVIVIGLLTECIVMGVKHNAPSVPATAPLTIALLLWSFIYIRLIGINKRNMAASNNQPLK